MALKAIRQVRTLYGSGQLEDPDGHSTGVSYSLVEHEKIMDAPNWQHPSDRFPGNNSLEGTIRAGRLPLARECVLHLEDGFRVKVIIKSSDGNVAHVESVGPPF